MWLADLGRWDEAQAEHRQVLTEAEVLAQYADGPTLSGLARLCALAAAAWVGGHSPGAVASTPVRPEYAARAVLLLRHAAAMGYRDCLYLKQGTDLAPLRNRKDFQMLLAGPDATTESHSRLTQPAVPTGNRSFVLPRFPYSAWSGTTRPWSLEYAKKSGTRSRRGETWLDTTSCAANPNS
jgi:hypothetical protein